MNHQVKSQEFDVEFARSQFPAFSSGLSSEWAHFDNAGGTYICGAVLERLNYFQNNNKVQPYGQNALAAAAGSQMDEGRRVMAELLGVPPETLTLGPSTTQNINTLSIACAGFIGAGDEIIVTEQDHEANIGCWERLSRLTGATLRFWPINAESGELDIIDLEKLVNKKTRIITVTHSSNIIGSLNPIPDIVRLAKAMGVRVVVDGVSCALIAGQTYLQWASTPTVSAPIRHTARIWGSCTSHRISMEQLTPQCHYFNTDKPWMRLDAAGPNHASIAALAGLGDYFSQLYNHQFKALDRPLHAKALDVSKLMNRHEVSLCKILLDALHQLPVRIIGKSGMAEREANVSLTSANHSSAALAGILAKNGIATKNGHFYAARLLKKVGIANPADGVLRLSFSHYNTRDETLRLVEVLNSALGK